MLSTNLVIGLTGGIGSGKSTVADLFKKRGVTIIDTDVIAREITEVDTDAYHQIVKQFGPTIVAKNKKLDRRALRKLIFSNDEHRQWLENLLHPRIRGAMKQQVKKAASSYCIAVIPLLLEGQSNPLISRILVVDVTEELQVERTRARDLQSTAEVEAIMRAQIMRSKRLAQADDVILNDGELADLEPQIDKLHQFYLSLCKPMPTSG